MLKVHEIGFIKNLSEHTKLALFCTGLILICGMMLAVGQVLRPSSFNLDPKWREYSIWAFETSVILNAVAFTLVLTVIASLIMWKVHPPPVAPSDSSVRCFQMLLLFLVLWCLSVLMFYFPRSYTYNDLNQKRPATVMEALHDGTVLSLHALTASIPTLYAPVKETYKVLGSKERGSPWLLRWIFEFNMFSLVLVSGFYILGIMEIWHLLWKLIDGHRPVHEEGCEDPESPTD